MDGAVSPKLLAGIGAPLSLYLRSVFARAHNADAGRFRRRADSAETSGERDDGWSRLVKSAARRSTRSRHSARSAARSLVWATQDSTRAKSGTWPLRSSARSR